MFPRSKKSCKASEVGMGAVVCLSSFSCSWLCCELALLCGCKGMFGILQRREGSPPGLGQPEGLPSKQMSSWHEARQV